MGKYDFIKTGNLLYWNNPDNNLSDGAYRVVFAPEHIEDNSIIRIATDSLGTEVLPSELSPIGRAISYKEDFCNGKRNVKPKAWSFTIAFPKSWTRRTIWLWVTW